MSSLALKWKTCGDDSHWCSFTNLTLSSINDTVGVYIIWHEGNPGRVVYVGQGDVAKRLCVHRNNKEITDYGKNGALRVTWASVPVGLMGGIERYLADKWNPLVGDAHPDVVPIAVNSPW